MILKDITLPTPAENILYDEVLLRRADAGQSGPVLRLWESPETFIVLGRIGRPEDDLHLDAVERDRVPVLRRSSGGGTVVQGPGCLSFSLVLSREDDPRLNDLRRSYAVILQDIIAALAKAGVDTRFHPLCDLALRASSKKISGNAQRRGRRFILHHGTMLYNFDLTLISRYLTMPKDIPEYRQGRPHEEFVANAPAGRDILRQSLLEQFHPSETHTACTCEERDMVRAIASERSPQIKIF